MASPLARDIVRTWRRNGLESLYPEYVRITVGMGTCGRASGASEVFVALKEAACSSGLQARIQEVGCRGCCWAEPLVEVQMPSGGRAVYGDVSPKDATRLMNAISNGEVLQDKLIGFQYADDLPLLGERTGIISDFRDLNELPYFAMQNRHITGKCGHIVAASVEEYAAYGGYAALARIIDGERRLPVVQEIEASDLRGRGGAGFPVGRKWRAVHDAESDVKYVIANADEGDPGAFMDRSLIEGDPHALIEGMTIAAYAIGANRGYVFTRSEYPHAIETLEKALAQAREKGVLGESVLGSRFSFDIRIIKSAGAYVCGEATALVRAMEGFPPRPRKRPPHLAECGLWGKPTCLNNVETFANIPLITMRGARWFRELGTKESPGTKTFSVAGCLSKTGLVEVALGMSIPEFTYMLTGERGNAEIKALQIGGPSGIIVPAHARCTLDFEGLAEAGGSIGSGGVVFLGRRDCVVDTVKYLTEFCESESCGQCRQCADGLSHCLELLGAITDGNANSSTLDELRACAERLQATSLCGLGKMAARPILSSLRFFGEEYLQHIERRCPGMVCKKLIKFSVIQKNCPGCRCCKPTCPTNAIQGRFGEPFHIDERLCIRCWMCTATCPYAAIQVHAGK